MASSSSSSSSSLTSSIPKRFKYDVFISFRGEDTRNNFVDHLYAALQQQGIHTFKDDKRLKKGKRIENELIKSIEDSRFFIIVFSKNYASSSWCLDELVKIMECHKTTEQTAYPVFYDVEPSEVCKQSGAVADAFSKHEKEDAAGEWREALEEAANLAGWELKNTADGHEAELIKKVVEEISLELRAVNTSCDENLIGMETRIKDVELSLELGSDDVRMIGIKGMGGGGKTTLSRAIFDQISVWFEGKSFVENVREVSKGTLSGLKSLQEKVLSDVLNEKTIGLSTIHDGKMIMKTRLHGKKVLVVLDDVDHIDQLEALAGARNWFKPGSRIIITTRDEQVLIAHRVNLIRDISLLSKEESVRLFSRYAFGREIPIQGYEKLSQQAVRYAAGLPLTIKVLGSFLCGKNKLEWEDALKRLKKIPLQETLEKLELSYIGLEKEYKEIFLDVACLLKGWDKERASRMLESCGFSARIGLRVLEQKSMIITTKTFQAEFIDMHSRIEEMGKNIVRRLDPDDPSRHSRLWYQEEIEDILANDLATAATKSIAVNSLVKLYSLIVTKGFGSFQNLTSLCLISEIDDDCVVKNDKIGMLFPNALKFLSWVGYPHWSLPKTFQATNLVGLEMPCSRIKCLWEEGEEKVLYKLRYIDLNHSRLRTLDLRLTRNLETLNLSGCHDLVELQLPIECLKLWSLKISHSKLTTLYLGLILNLKVLKLKECHDLVELHMPAECPKLRSLNLSHSKSRNLHLQLTPNLEMLDLVECHDLVELRMPAECPKLRSLNLSHSKLRTLDLGLTPNLEMLDLVECHDLVLLSMPAECLKLRSLNLSHSKLKTLDLGLTPNLEMLDLVECHDLVLLRMPAECLKLRSLNLSHSKLKTLDLGLTPNLEMLDLQDCYHLEELHTPFGCLKRLVFLNLSGCSKIESFLFIKQLESLEVLSLTRLYMKEFPDMIIPRHLDNSLLEFRFRYNDIYELPSSIENLQQLVYLDLHSCRKLKVLPGSICSLRNLRNLKLYGCSLEELPEDIGRLECLEKLNLSFTSIKHLPDSICMLKNLKTLNLSSCWNLEKLPEDIGQLECLQNLILKECTQVRDVPDSICMLKELKYLSFLDCIQLQKLPEELGHLRRLEELNINGTRIRFLPPSISLLTELKICGPKSGIRGIMWNESASQIKDSEASKAEGEHQFKKQRTSVID